MVGSYYETVANPWTLTPGKIADEYQGMTTALKIKGSYNLVTNDKGLGACAVQPNLNNMFLHAGAALGQTTSVDWVTTTGLNWNVFASNDLGNLDGSYTSYRIVSYGVSVSYVGGETDAKGEITVCHSQGGTSATYETVLANIREVPCAVIQPITYITKPVMVAVHNYDRPSFKPVLQDFQTVCPTTLIAVIGGPVSQALLKVDIQFNLELVPKINSLHAHLASSSPSSSNEISRVRRLAAARVSTTGPGGLRSSMTGATVSAPRKRKIVRRRKIGLKRHGRVKRRVSSVPAYLKRYGGGRATRVGRTMNVM